MAHRPEPPRQRGQGWRCRPATPCQHPNPGGRPACDDHGAIPRRTPPTRRQRRPARLEPGHHCRARPTRPGHRPRHVAGAGRRDASPQSFPPFDPLQARSGVGWQRQGRRAGQRAVRPRGCRGRWRRYPRCAAAAGPRVAPVQTEMEARPLRRRAERIDRPARVRIRRRKPCFLCRRRLFGWNVRFDIAQLRCWLVRLAARRGAAAHRRVTDADGRRGTQ